MAGTVGRRRLPVLPAAADDLVARQRRAAHGVLPPVDAARAARAGARAARARRSGREGEEAARRRLGRGAAAGGDRPGAGDRCAAPCRRRADRQPRLGNGGVHDRPLRAARGERKDGAHRDARQRPRGSRDAHGGRRRRHGRERVRTPSARDVRPRPARRCFRAPTARVVPARLRDRPPGRRGRRAVHHHAGRGGGLPPVIPTAPR